jgi:signal transduction histidine kinase
VEGRGGVAGPRSLRQLLDAVISIGTGLDLTTTLRRIIEAATSLADAHYGALGVLDPAGTALSEFITVGIDEQTRAEIGDLPKGHGILGLLIAQPRPIRLPDLREHPDSFGFPPNHPPMRSFLGVPITVRGVVFGNLYLTDKQSAEVFSDVDEELVVALATAAGVAIDNARLHAREQELALFQDRERIGMDLHDTVIQQLFAIGLSLQATSRLLTDAGVVARVQRSVDDLDETIKRIRSTIFALDSAARGVGTGLRDRVLMLAEELTPPLARKPRVLFEGSVDTSLPVATADELVTTLRELLSNIARHAEAGEVDVYVAVDDEFAILRVSDDGKGPPDPDKAPAGRGLYNLTVRAERLGGTFSFGSRPTGRGSQAEWRVPRR